MSGKNHRPGDVVDLDDVISPTGFSRWQVAAEIGARAFISAGIQLAQIPIERGLILETGELEIFVEVPGVARISMKIPRTQWWFR